MAHRTAPTTAPPLEIWQDAEVLELRRLVEQLTQRDPRVRDTRAKQWICCYCGCLMEDASPAHDLTCIWDRARRLLARTAARVAA